MADDIVGQAEQAPQEPEQAPAEPITREEVLAVEEDAGARLYRDNCTTPGR